MKYLALTIMLVSCINIFGQEQNSKTIPKDILKQIDKMGVDNSPLLNNTESTYLNLIFKDNLKGFDFTGKKIGFIRNGGKGKSNYFDMQKNRITDKGTPCDDGTLYIFNSIQRVESGGYDGAIVYWSKFVVPIEKVIAKLKKQR